MFAAAYGFPPSACRDAEEAIGLLRNIGIAVSLKSVSVAGGAAAALSQEAAADLAERLGESPKAVASMRLEAMKSAARSQKGGQRW